MFIIAIAIVVALAGIGFMRTSSRKASAYNRDAGRRARELSTIVGMADNAWGRWT